MKANAEQATEQWVTDRLGCWSGSTAADLMAKGRSGPSVTRANLITKLALERLTGKPVEGYRSSAMERGIALEAEAVIAYSLHTMRTVTSCGFIRALDLPNTGASPDGQVDDDGLLEIKCPDSMTKHLTALRSGSHAAEYRWQLQCQLMVTGRKWVDIVSYDPRYPKQLQIAINRVLPDQHAISELRAAIWAGELEVTELVEQLRDMRGA